MSQQTTAPEGREGATKPRPASQETCPNNHPVRARGVPWTSDVPMRWYFHRLREPLRFLELKIDKEAAYMRRVDLYAQVIRVLGQ